MPREQNNRPCFSRDTFERNPMSLIAKLSISLIITAIASALTTTLLAGETISFLDIRLTLAFFVATVATAILVGSMAAPSRAAPAKSTFPSESDDTDREIGTVKWFNVSKGFGFIVREDGEEIFVHFRSIRGEGRRSLRDGQSVSFVVTQSDKGPQAEDVIGED
jgi:CspA family cold shock protein